MSIPVYDNAENHNKIIAKVSHQRAGNLDYWDGSNMTNGGAGLHKGLTKLKRSQQYVIIITSDWENNKDYGYVVPPEEAANEILISGNEDLFEDFPDLKKVDTE